MCLGLRRKPPEAIQCLRLACANRPSVSVVLASNTRAGQAPPLQRQGKTPVPGVQGPKPLVGEGVRESREPRGNLNVPPGSLALAERKASMRNMQRYACPALSPHQSPSVTASPRGEASAACSVPTSSVRPSACHLLLKEKAKVRAPRAVPKRPMRRSPHQTAYNITRLLLDAAPFAVVK